MRDLPWHGHDTVSEMLLDATVRLGLAMRSAPLMSAEFAYKVDSPNGDSQWVPGIQADDPAVGKFVHRQLKRIWRNDLHKLLRAQMWGWAAGEVMLRYVDGLVEIDKILYRQPQDTIALQRDGEIAGVRFKRVKASRGYVDLAFPKSIWHAFDPENEQPYGRTICRGAHSPWFDKACDGGALDIRRLFAHKDAYGGVDIGYPSGTTPNPDGEEIPNRDIARELAEQIQSGGVTARPSERHEDGSEQWPLTRASIPASPTHIFDYPKDLDTEILRGLEIPDDVLISETTGAWQGKQVPMMAFYTSIDIWLGQLVECAVTQVIEPLVVINFGAGHRFEVTTKPLAEQIMEQMQSATQPTEQEPVEDEYSDFTRSKPKPSGLQRFSIEELVGSGEVEASAVAPKHVLRLSVNRIASAFGLTAQERELVEVASNGRH